MKCSSTVNLFAYFTGRLLLYIAFIIIVVGCELLIEGVMDEGNNDEKILKKRDNSDGVVCLLVQCIILFLGIIPHPRRKKAFTNRFIL